VQGEVCTDEVCAGEGMNDAPQASLQSDFPALFSGPKLLLAGVVAAACFADMLEFSRCSNA
jgi:hypothetical protein